MIRKNDRVQFMLEGVLTHGTVIKGGSSKITVILDGGDSQASGSTSLFQPSTKPFPKDVPSPMDDYGIKGYKEIDGHGDSRTFDAIITYKGRLILQVSNNGWGGSDCYHPAGDKISDKISGKDCLAAFFKDVKETVRLFGYEDLLEPEDAWVEWYIHKRPYAVTFQEEIDSYKAFMKV